MYLVRLCGLHDNGDSGVLPCLYKVIFKSRNCKEGGDCKVILVNASVGEDKDRCALFVSLVSLSVKAFNGLSECGGVLAVEH